MPLRKLNQRPGESIVDWSGPKLEEFAAPSQEQPKEDSQYEWWCQFIKVGGYQYMTSTGIDNDLFWRTREAVGYAPGSGQYPRQKQPEGKSIVDTLPDYDLYVYSYFAIEEPVHRGYQFIMCVLVPKSERLDINSIPFINNEEAVKIAEQTNNRSPPLKLPRAP